MPYLATLMTVLNLMVSVSYVWAQDLPPDAVRTAAPLNPMAETFIAGDSVEPLVLAEWEVVNDMGSRIRIVWGQEAVDAAPPEASRYTQMSYVFPTGSIRVLDFKKDQGGMLHAITVENQLYMMKGTGTVEVAGETVSVGEGDVVSYPSGTLRGDGDSTVILWTVTGTKINQDAKAMVVRAADAPMSYMAYWGGPDGERVVVATPEDLENTPDDAIRLDIKSYAFDGNTVGVIKTYRGGPTNEATGDRDGLLYITSGKARFVEEEVEVIVGPGDAIRETAGKYHYWIRLEDSSFISTGTAPVVPVELDTISGY